MTVRGKLRTYIFNQLLHTKLWARPFIKIEIEEDGKTPYYDIQLSFKIIAKPLFWTIGVITLPFTILFFGLSHMDEALFLFNVGETYTTHRVFPDNKNFQKIANYKNNQ